MEAYAKYITRNTLVAFHPLPMRNKDVTRKNTCQI